LNFLSLTDTGQFNDIDSGLSLIFKHSTRCSISTMAFNRLKSGEDFPGVKVYYLDLLKFRPISDFISEKYHVEHESPQVLLLVDGKCVFHASHNAISNATLASEIRNVSLKITS